MNLLKSCSLLLAVLLVSCVSVPRDDIRKEISVSWNRVVDPSRECQQAGKNSLTLGKQVVCFVPPPAGGTCNVYSREDAPEILLGEAFRGCLGESADSTSLFSFGKAEKEYLKAMNVKIATIRWKQADGFRSECSRFVPQWAVPQVLGGEGPIVAGSSRWTVPQNPGKGGAVAWGCSVRYPRGETVNCNIVTPHKVHNIALGEEFIHCFGYDHRD